MAKTLDAVAAEALGLSADERAELVQRLLDSLPRDPELAAAWDEEIARRVALFEAGELEFVPAESVFADLRGRRRP